MASSEKVEASHAVDSANDFWLLGITLLLLALVYSATFLSFYNVFSEEGSDQSHAPLLLLIAIYLVYRAWAIDRKQIKIQVNPLFVFMLAGMSVLWLAASLVFVEAGQQFSLIMMIALVVLALLGIRDGRRYLVPIVVLLTALPVWTIFVPHLQTSSAVLSSVLLDLSGITSTRDGYLIIIPNGIFEVADSCSGLNLLTVSIGLALIHTQLTRVNFTTAVLYVLSAAGLAILANIVRIYIIVIIGYLYGMDHDLVRDHIALGWLVFALLLIPFLMVGEKVLQRRRINPEAVVSNQTGEQSKRRRLFGVLMVILAFSLGPGLYSYFNSAESHEVTDTIRVGDDLGGWVQYSSELKEWRPLWTDGDRLLEASFRKGSDVVDLYATQFLKQNDGREAVNISHRVYDIDKWSRISRSSNVIELGDRGIIEVEETVLRSSGNKRRLVWQWYLANDKFVQGNAKAKLNNLVGTLRGQPDITVYILSKEIPKDEAHATGVLTDFLSNYLIYNR
jgi:EpsI family protein